VVVHLSQSDTFVLLAHLQSGSIRVSVGQELADGQQIARCGNSGNSTQPHVHVQVMDDADPLVARGVRWPSGGSGSGRRAPGSTR
jgi:murein DD-endopeptidase MepM/ murein hydrolase activator NlpD